MGDDEITLAYEGMPALVGKLAQDLEAEGFEVHYEAPPEFRSVGSDAHAVVLVYLKAAVGAGGAVSAKATADAVIARFKARWPGTTVDHREGSGYS